MAGKKKKNYSYSFPRPSLTVDIAIVTIEANPKVLLIQRKAEPCAGKWALPGGFVDENERLIDAARRELREETGLDQLDLEQFRAFGDPDRDPRGWTVTVVYMARVRPKERKPKAGDDAKAVKWFPLNDLPDLAFDHEEILDRVRIRLADLSE